MELCGESAEIQVDRFIQRQESGAEVGRYGAVGIQDDGGGPGGVGEGRHS